MVEKIAEGKTKIIWSTPDREVVLIESKDDITAGDGVKRDVVEKKGALSTETTCNCFSLINARGIPTHFIGREDEKTFRALRVKMFPIELVVRRIATGSYLKRHPEVIEGVSFDPLVFEAFCKDDEFHDPIMIWRGERRCFELYHAKAPWPKGYLYDLRPDCVAEPLGRPFGMQDLKRLQEITCNVFLTLEGAWQKLNVRLVDLKIECGCTPKGDIVVADVVDNDSWRIWPGGDKARMMDKQVYRNLGQPTAEALEVIKKNYVWVAEATRRFI